MAPMAMAQPMTVYCYEEKDATSSRQTQGTELGGESIGYFSPRRICVIHNLTTHGGYAVPKDSLSNSAQRQWLGIKVTSNVTGY